MVYRMDGNSSKHQDLPFRLNRDQIAAVIDERKLRCTHIDAIRFFTESAFPKNTVTPSPSRLTQPSSDQPGCVHVHMDLFK